MKILNRLTADIFLVFSIVAAISQFRMILGGNVEIGEMDYLIALWIMTPYLIFYCITLLFKKTPAINLSICIASLLMFLLTLVFYMNINDSSVCHTITIFIKYPFYLLVSIPVFLGISVVLAKIIDTEKLKPKSEKNFTMEIGRLIERNILIFIGLFLFVSRLAVYFIGGQSGDEDMKFIYCYYSGKYICWPHKILFPEGAGTGYLLNTVIIYIMSLVGFMTGDFLLRKVIWNRKKDIAISIVNQNATSKFMIVSQIITSIVKWGGRLLACAVIPFLMYFFDFSDWHYHDAILHGPQQEVFESQIGLAGALIAIFGCIIGWRYPLIGAIMMLAWVIPSQIMEGKFYLDYIFISFDAVAIAFLITWVIEMFSKKGLTLDNEKQKLIV